MRATCDHSIPHPVRGMRQHHRRDCRQRQGRRRPTVRPLQRFHQGAHRLGEGHKGRFREAIITWSRSYDQCVSIRPVTYKSKGIERWHHHLVLLEAPEKV